MVKTTIEVNCKRVCKDREKTYYSIPQNNLTMKISEAILKLKDCKVESYLGNKIEVSTGSYDRVWVECDNNCEIKEIQRSIRASQVQLYQYILHKYYFQRTREVKLNVQEYFKTKGVTRRKENMDRFIVDLLNLQKINFDIETNYKGKKTRVMNKLLSFKGYIIANDFVKQSEISKGEKISEVILEIGEWVNYLDFKQFMQVNEEFFIYNSKSQCYQILLSLKLGQLIRINHRKISANSKGYIKIKSIFEFIGVNEIDVIKQGKEYYKVLLESAFRDLSKYEGYIIKILEERYSNYNDFLNTQIEYTNLKLLNQYQSIVKRSA